MDWNTSIERHREVLHGIVALLFALAGLADRAAGRSRCVRREVLSILAPAESRTCEFILHEAQASGIPILFMPLSTHEGGGVDEAMQLAARFRMLAVVLAYVCTQAWPATRRQEPRHIWLSDLPRSVEAARQIGIARRRVGFRALDSPTPETCCG